MVGKMIQMEAIRMMPMPLEEIGGKVKRQKMIISLSETML